MHLIFYHVAELKHVNNTYGSGLVEAFAGAAIVEVGLAVAGQACFVGPLVEVIHAGTVENGSGEFFVQLTTGPAEYSLENLTKVHTRRHTQRVQTDINRSTVGKEGHVFLAHDTRHDTLVTVAACHFVAHADFTFLGNVYLGNLHDARGQFVAYADVEFLTAEFGVDFLALAQIVNYGLADEVVLMVVVCPLRQVNGVVVDSGQCGGSETRTLGNNLAADKVLDAL